VNKALNVLSLIGSFLIVFGILFLIQDQTVGRIPYISRPLFLNTVRLKDLIFTATSLLFILKFIDFYIPKRRGNQGHS
jgi:hypothetical protein